MKPKLILIRGLPGSGKSTLAKEIVFGKEDWDHFEADAFFVNTKGEYVFNPKLLYNAHHWCLTSTFESLYAGKNVVVSNTFTTSKELKPYFNMFFCFGVVPQIIHCQGNWGSVHNVPQETIDKMKNRWQNDLSSLYKWIGK